ncbi:MAG: hypothetical protein CL949_20770 [Erythrobacter sp.]|nr:hypothetical protein [Erythrobacter sp.]
MKATAPTLIVLGSFALAACNSGGGEAQQPPSQANQQADASEMPAPPPPPPPPAAGALADNGVNDGTPDLTPPSLSPEAEKTEKGARNIATSFARAIELKEFDQAWALLDHASKRKWSKTQWAGHFSDLTDISVAVGSGRMEGAAGSSYYTAPLDITATDTSGRPVRYDGEMILKRVNDVPGATAEQLRWHMNSLALDWTH